jgi:hypothetical protein
MGSGSYGFMRALYGFIVCGFLGVAVSLVTKPKPLNELTGLVTGTQLEAMRLYKGGEINRNPGKKARVRVQVNAALPDPEIVIVPKAALAVMAGRPGDILYVSDPRWWFGGLRSVHVRAGEPGDGEALQIHPEALADAHLRDGQAAHVEVLL